MSKIALTPNALGTGTLTVAAPNTNTDRTLTLPDITGTLVSSDASGNVGIGTSSPTEKLSVVGSGTFTGNIHAKSGSNAYLSVVGTTVPTNSPYIAVFNGAATRIGYSSYWTGTDYVVAQTDGATALAFGTNGTERMRIDTSGNLLVGKSSSTNDVTTAGTLIQSNGKGVFTTTGATQTLVVAKNSSTSGSLIDFYYNGSVVGSVTTSGTATAYNTSSDYRLKENVQPMTGALDKIAQLNPVTYTWKADGSDGQGFIAHELQAIVPDCVSGEKDAVDADGKPQYQGVDTSFLVATLVKAIQELTARIAVLEAK